MSYHLMEIAKMVKIIFKERMAACTSSLPNVRSRSHRGILLLVLLLLLQSAFTRAEERRDKPLWELGLVGIGGYGPDYPAADESQLKGLPLPYLIYRGKILRAGDKGLVRGRFFRSERLEFDLSLEGSFDAESDDNFMRRGMPDLDYLFEIGPRLQITLKKDVMKGKLDLELPLRAVIATDFTSLSYEGLVFHPQLAWQDDDFLGSGTRLKVGAGPIFFSEKFMDYFYEVEPRFATSGRTAFNARSGYLGSELQVAAIKKLGKHLSIFQSIGLDFYEGSANNESSLFRDDFTVSFRVGLIWRAYQSTQKADE